MVDEHIKKWIADIMDRREYTECWFVDDEGNHGDCGNWPTCNPHCTLREMMDHVGIAPQEDGGRDKQPVEAKRTHVLAEWTMKHNALEAENATLQTRVEELERLLRLCAPWIDANLVIMETGEFLRPVILKALESQPQKETKDA